jgi:hypothetical protein
VPEVSLPPLHAMATRSWSTPFLGPITAADANSDASKRALIILNQPFAPNLLARLWAHCAWRACADGGANRLHDALGARRDECVHPRSGGAEERG